MGLEAALLLAFVAALVGFFAGRAYADAHRAKTDMRRIWRSRSDHWQQKPKRRK